MDLKIGGRKLRKIVVISGYFNPLHIGHLRLIEEARSLGDELVVIVNNDKQQLVKKGKIIMNENDRCEIVNAIWYVDQVLLSIDEDQTITATLKYLAVIHENDKLIFANGGDRDSKKAIPETALCEEHNIELVFGVGGIEKLDSSTNINKLRNIE